MAGPGLTGVQELAGALRGGSSGLSISTQGSALLVLTALQSRDCARNSTGGEAEKKSGGFIYEKASINLHEPVQSDDKKVLQLIGEQGKYLLQGQGRG